MTDQELIRTLREHAEWAQANEWEVPITLGDDLKAAYDCLMAHMTAVTRLKAYEDTLLEPEEIVAMRNTLDEYHKVADPLLLAKAQGRVVVLPVAPVLTPAISSLLYVIEDGEIYEDALYEAVVGMSSSGEVNVIYTTLSDQMIFEQADIGKTVFLTREEAERSLECKNE